MQGMESLPEPWRSLLALAGITIMVLGWAAQRWPDVEWLRHFDFSSHLTPEQRERLQRRDFALGGMQFVLLGLVIPLGYLVLEAMTFSSVTTLELVLVGAVSLVCLGVGVYGVSRSFRRS
jgi:hypothetical protein